MPKTVDRSVIEHGAEYALYYLAIKHPDIMREAETMPAQMLANDRPALERARVLLESWAEGR